MILNKQLFEEEHWHSSSRHREDVLQSKWSYRPTPLSQQGYLDRQKASWINTFRIITQGRRKPELEHIFNNGDPFRPLHTVRQLLFFWTQRKGEWPLYTSLKIMFEWIVSIEEKVTWWFYRVCWLSNALEHHVMHFAQMSFPHPHSVRETLS